ncbi:hypothetical protein [Hazenella coriacea]|uniref:Uncharacterized protein n=1 Tax=Hazenella coriacea TaxID=1179467 RepID=A0A4R3LBS4_9BACL|nr:hypothetical protein [Hazenella coriacea]TCS94966.1 hypothetical protein EDD58_103391 [Hazenella coriacea]
MKTKNLAVEWFKGFEINLSCLTLIFEKPKTKCSSAVLADTNKLTPAMLAGVFIYPI